MHRLFDHIPNNCPLCGERSAGRRLCAGCLRALDGVDARPRCARCGLPLGAEGAPCWPCLRDPPPFDAAFVAMPYQPPYDRLIGLLKHRHQLWVAHCLAQRMLARTGWMAGVPGNVDAIVAIPAGHRSLRRRGFNPAGEIARECARLLARRPGRTGLRTAVWRAGALARTRDGPKQSELGRTARLREAVDLFVARDTFAGQHVALVDDVMTTGGTLAAAAWALRDAGAARITVLVAARTAERLS